MRYCSSSAEKALEENNFWIDYLRLILQYSLPRNRNSISDKTSYLAKLLCKKTAVVSLMFQKKKKSHQKQNAACLTKTVEFCDGIFLCNSVSVLRLSEKCSLKTELNVNKNQTSYARLSSLLQPWVSARCREIKVLFAFVWQKNYINFRQRPKPGMTQKEHMDAGYTILSNYQVTWGYMVHQNFPWSSARSNEKFSKWERNKDCWLASIFTVKADTVNASKAVRKGLESIFWSPVGVSI